jgi:hypothetical protein
VGALGLEHTTRRRNRVNGRVLSVGGGKAQKGKKTDPSCPALHLEVDLSFGNCPKYIQRRWWAEWWQTHGICRNLHLPLRFCIGALRGPRTTCRGVGPVGGSAVVGQYGAELFILLR